VLAINLTGVFLCIKYELPRMLETGGGSIVNVASILGLVGFANAPAYTAAKHGVVGLTKVAALEYSALGVRVNALCPGFIETPMVMERGVEAGAHPEVYEQLVTLHPMMGDMGSMDSGDILYPLYLVNGRPPEDSETLEVRRRERIRLRLMNPAAETIFRFAAAGHKLSVTHADGQPVEPVTVDAVRIGMGERYDVILEANNPGVWQLAAVPEGKGGLAHAVLRYGESSEESAPPAEFLPKELGSRLLSYADLKNAGGRSFPEDGLIGGPDRARELTLAGGHGDYVWTIDDQLYPDAEPLEVREGEWVRFELQNNSMMPHPMHLHGHFFQVENGTGHGPFKDTALVEPHMGHLVFDFVADNPGEWFFHCHNAYHMETGMARVVSYVG
jgi:multicopper oxidase